VNRLIEIRMVIFCLRSADLLPLERLQQRRGPKKIFFVALQFIAGARG
jgi:hypothetical protein